MQRNHVVITGTGRAGTSFLVQLLTNLGLDTGFGQSGMSLDENCRAGLEHNIFKDDAPYIVKSIWFAHFVDEVLAGPEINIEHVFIPMRDLYAAAENRRHVVRKHLETLDEEGRKNVKGNELLGGLMYTADPEEQESVLLLKLYELLVSLSKTNIPVTLLQFPKSTYDADYLYKKLQPVLGEISFETFAEVHSQTVRPEWVNRFGGSVRDMAENGTSPSEHSSSPVIRNFNQLARAYSKHVDDFFFIQVGANNGREGDPLFELVTEFGWRGVLVEPQKDICENRLVANYAGQDGLFFENVAIDAIEGHRELFRLSFSQERWATGLASFKKSHLVHHIENGYVDRMMKGREDQLPAEREEYICSEIVRTMTFTTLLDKYQVKHLDLLQIDTEGYDYHLLQQYDFESVKPAIIQFEHHVMTNEQRSRSVELLERHGYFLFKGGTNIVGIQRKLSDELNLKFDIEEIKSTRADITPG